MRDGEKILEGGEEMEREQTTIRLPAELKDQIQREAEKVNLSKGERVWTGTLDLPEGCTLLKSSLNVK